MNELLGLAASLSDAALIAEIDTLAVKDRDVTTRLIASLAEFDARRLYVGQGFPSLYSYCTEKLRLSEHAAYSRIEAARTAQRFPLVLDLLASGEITMTTVVLLSKHLTNENHVQLLEAARHRTRREVELQVAALGGPRDLRNTLLPLGEGRHRLEVTISDETRQALHRLQELLRHRFPDGDLSKIVEEAIRERLVAVEKQRLAAVRRPRAHGLEVSHTRHGPAAVKRAIWARDKAQCAFVGTEGRCPERAFLELHHVIPFSHGGATSVDNLQLRCRTHNVYEAELQVGATT